jgi:hypothetical protein
MSPNLELLISLVVLKDLENYFSAIRPTPMTPRVLKDKNILPTNRIELEFYWREKFALESIRLADLMTSRGQDWDSFRAKAVREYEVLVQVNHYWREGWLLKDCSPNG